MSAIVDITELADFTVDLYNAAVRAPYESARLTKQYGDILTFAVKTKASGRPGPEPITGRYRNSITLKFTFSGNKSDAEVFTHEPQGFRLEYGYYGTDSIGRQAESAPYPHFVPALYAVAPIWENALGQRMTELVLKGK